ncbi:vWA domain-containing protein [Gordonia terrae]
MTLPKAVPPTALVLDASDSMLIEDAPGQRFAAARRAATTLVEALPTSTELAVVAYGTGTSNRPQDFVAGCRDVRTLTPLGPVDAAAVRSVLDSTQPRGFTPIAASLRHAAALLPVDEKTAIVLISDGEDTCGQPPCPIAEELKRANPQLEISTIGFKTEGAASLDLQCIADVTGGLFVTAANDAQLRARLLAAQDTEGSRNTLNGPGLLGITLGDPLTEIRERRDDFPAGGRRVGDTTIIVWKDCEWVFGSDGRLAEIRPGQGFRTIDGLNVGSTVAEMVALYGEPLEDSTSAGRARMLLFAPDPTTTTGYRVEADGPGGDARITRIVVCDCAPRRSVSNRQPKQTVLQPFTSAGQTSAGWLKDTTRAGGYFGCRTESVPGVLDDGLYWCSGSSGMNQGVCAPAAEERILLCVTDPFTEQVLLLAPSESIPASVRPMEPAVPFGLILADGTRCTYRGISGSSPPNSSAPNAGARYACGEGPDAPLVWSEGTASFPIDRTGTSWTVRVGPPGSSPLRTEAVDEVIYVGIKQ